MRPQRHAVTLQRLLVFPDPVGDDPGRDFGLVAALDAEGAHPLEDALCRLRDRQLKLDGFGSLASGHDWLSLIRLLQECNYNVFARQEGALVKRDFLAIGFA